MTKGRGGAFPDFTPVSMGRRVVTGQVRTVGWEIKEIIRYSVSCIIDTRAFEAGVHDRRSCFGSIDEAGFGYGMALGHGYN